MKAEKVVWTVNWSHHEGKTTASLRPLGPDAKSEIRSEPLRIPDSAQESKRLVLDAPFERSDDPALIARLHTLCRIAARSGIATDTTRLPESTQSLLRLSTSTPLDAPPDPRPQGFLVRVGLGVFEARRAVVSVIGFIGQITLSLATFAVGRAVTRRADIFSNFSRCGPGSLMIVSLIAFLVGLIISFVAAVQLAIFGATIFVADLISIVMFRELGVIMTAVLLSGRIGAAFAAELGSMRNNEEIDALTTAGVNPIQFLVLPRFIAMVFATPILSMYASFIGVLGGLLLASGAMGIVPDQFFARVIAAMTLGNLWAGFIKGFIFGAIIAITGCLKGLNAKRGAEGVGAAATSAVVTSITWIIIADAIFAVLLFVIGI